MDRNRGSDMIVVMVTLKLSACDPFNNTVERGLMRHIYLNNIDVTIRVVIPKAPVLV
jgi:phosphoribosylformylglycinamidine (FGAM) synthase PurS component